MKQIYLFILLVIGGCFQIQPVSAITVRSTAVNNMRFGISQTITFAAIPVQIPGRLDFDPGAYASSGLSIVYSIPESSAGVAVIVDNKVRIVGVGTAVITAMQPGNAVFNAATAVTQTLTVQQLAITTALGAKPFSTTDLALATNAGLPAGVTYVSDDPAVVSIVNNQLHYVGAGTTTVYAKQPANALYNEVLSAKVSVAVSKINQVITLPAVANNQVFGRKDFDPGATSTSGIMPVYSITSGPATIEDNKVHLTGTGSVTVKADFAGDLRFNPANSSITFTVVNLTVPALGTKTFTTTDFALTVYGAPANITYSSSNPNVATVINNKIHYVGLGSTTIVANQAENAQFNAVTSPGVVLTVNQSTAHTLTFAALGNKAFSTTDLDPNATSSLIDKTFYPITYTVPTNPYISIVDNRIHFLSVGGPVTITATQTGNANFTTKTATATITVTAPTLTIAAIPTKVVGAVDVDLAATTTSTISPVIAPITYTSSNPNAAYIYQKTKLRFVGVGNAQITATQEATAITPRVVSPVVSIASPGVTAAVITFNQPSAQPFSDVDYTLVATSTFPVATAPIVFTSSDETKAIIVNNKLHFVGTGSVVITASQPLPAPYVSAPVPVSRTLTINAAVITFATLGTKSLSDVDLTLAATSSLTSEPVTYTSSDPNVATIVGNKLHYVGLGTTTITASQAGTGVADVSNQLEVVAPVITFPALGSKVFTVVDFPLNATSTITGVPIVYTSSNPDVARIASGVNIRYVGVGQTVITASQGTSGGTLPFSQVLTVTPATNSGVITFANRTQPFSPVDIAPGATSTIAVADVPLSFTSDNESVAKIVNVSGTFMVRPMGVGVANITASQSGSLPKTAVFTFSQPTLTIAATRNIPFGTVDVAPAAVTTLILDPIIYASSNPEVATIVDGKIHMVGMGVTEIRASQASAGTSIYNAPADAIQTLTVDRPLITFTPTSIVRPWNSSTDILPTASTGTAANPANTTVVLNSTVTDIPITLTSSNPAVVSIVDGKLHFNALGTTVIKASQAAASGVLAPLPSEQTLTVNVKMLPTTATYGDADINPGEALGGIPVNYTSSNTNVALPILDPALNLNTTIRIRQAGLANITVGNTVGTLNYPSTATVVVPLVIAKAPLDVKVKNYTRYFGEEDPLPTLWPLQYNGFTKAFGAADLDDETAIGTTPSTFNNKLVVSPANQNDLIVSATGRNILQAGVYPDALTASGGASTNYLMTFRPGTLTVLPFPQSLAFDELNKRYVGDVDFDPLARSTGNPVTYTSSNPNVATIVNGKVHITGAGTSTITASIVASRNYSGQASLDRVLTVERGVQSISASQIPVLKVGTEYVLDAQASSGLPVQYTISDVRPISLVGQTVKGLRIGETIVTVSQAGNENYLPAELKIPVKVMAAGVDLVQFTQALTPNGDGKNDYLFIDGLSEYPKNRVTILNTNGTKVFKAENYNNTDKVFAAKTSSGGEYLPAGTYYCVIEYKVSNNWEKKTGYLVIKY